MDSREVGVEVPSEMSGKGGGKEEPGRNLVHRVSAIVFAMAMVILRSLGRQHCIVSDSLGKFLLWALFRNPQPVQLA